MSKTIMLDIPASAEERYRVSQLRVEVERRKDAVVDAAVEWHQAGREGAEWFDKAEMLSAAIDSLLGLRDEPATKSREASNNPEPSQDGQVSLPAAESEITRLREEIEPLKSKLQESYRSALALAEEEKQHVTVRVRAELIKRVREKAAMFENEVKLNPGNAWAETWRDRAETLRILAKELEAVNINEDQNDEGR